MSWTNKCLCNTIIYPIRVNRIFRRTINVTAARTRADAGKYFRFLTQMRIIQIQRLATHSLPEKNNKDGRELNLRDFMSKVTPSSKLLENNVEQVPYLDVASLRGDNRKVYLEVYGCQMNVNDAEVVWAVLQDVGYEKTVSIDEADVILLITCAIREGPEEKIWARLDTLNKLKKKKLTENPSSTPIKIGLLGCMAERLKEKVLVVEKSIDFVAGPDSYKDLPRLLALTRCNQKAANVLLSLDETYADIMPVRLNQDSVTSYVTIMRGCNNMCTYCIVPFTRGRERSRPIKSILDEVKNLSENGVKEITLLGQNVNSFNDLSESSSRIPADSSTNALHLSKGFKSIYKISHRGICFAELLDRVADVDPEIRIRFTSPHPKDFPDKVLEVIKNKPNICKSLHLPPQSGNNVILERMRRGYTREAYLELVERIRSYLPNVMFSGDFILGFCGETEDQYQDTVTLLKAVKFSKAFIYAYSMREKTTAHRRYEDDVPRVEKLRRVTELSTIFRQIADELHRKQVGERQLVLIEGNSRKSSMQLVGKNDGNIKVVVPRCELPADASATTMTPLKAGDYVCVQIEEANSQILKGRPLFRSSIANFYSQTSECVATFA